ncbi:hypothetical protein OROMI_025307 [Orobanche minor]
MLFIYTIEFQKQGLIHAHIILFLERDNQVNMAEYMDKFIYAEIPDKETNPELYEVVSDYMVHGPCGAANLYSYMVDGKCSKCFPKSFNERTIIDDQGYHVYKRRDTGSTIEKNGVSLDNRFIVSYNHYMLLKYQAHINVEYCNQSRAIKYLFKYIIKGNDRITARFFTSGVDDEGTGRDDEIK